MKLVCSGCGDFLEDETSPVCERCAAAVRGGKVAIPGVEQPPPPKPNPLRVVGGANRDSGIENVLRKALEDSDRMSMVIVIMRDKDNGHVLCMHSRPADTVQLFGMLKYAEIATTREIIAAVGRDDG